jgi:hypothetical protein
VQAVAGALRLGQQAGGVAAAGQCLHRAQLQRQRRRRQRDARQVFGQQALQVHGVKRGLGAAQQQLALGGGIAARVHGPAQHQRQHRPLAQLQPELQLLEQPARTKQQRRRGLHLCCQLQTGLEHLGHKQPGVSVRALAASLVQRLQQRRAKTPRYTGARQGPQLAPAGAAQGRQRGQVRACRRQGRQRQLWSRGVGQTGQQPGFCYQRSSALSMLDEGWSLI